MRRHVLLLSILLLASCGGDPSNGLLRTHDGRMVSETAEVAHDELAYQLGQRATDAMGGGWVAKAAITEQPQLNAVHADEWGWRTMSVALTLIPPAGAAADPALSAKAEAAVRDAAIYRVRAQADITVATSVLAAGTPAPGSSSYTTVAGDTFAGISTAFYGTPQHWHLIADANPRIDAADLKAGTVLVIPPKP